MDLDTVPLGRTGLSVSELAFGTWRFGRETAQGRLEIDVLYIHRWDEDTPTRELMRTLDGLVDDGRVHYLGASTLQPNAWRLAEVNDVADRYGWEPFTVTQPRYNLVNREIEGEYLDCCRANGLAVVPWSPLAQGFLTGKYERDGGVPEESTASDTEGWADRYLTAENFDALDVVRGVADETGATPAQVALAYHTHHPDVTAPIVGARTVDQLEENLRAATVDLSADQFERLAAAKAGPFEDLL